MGKTQPAQEPAAQEKIHALKPMLEALRIKQVVSFSESQKLLAEVANKSGMLPPAFEISGNQWCALVNLAVTRFGNTTPPKREWVGLTPEETPGFTSQELALVKYVSRVLQEKNS